MQTEPDTNISEGSIDSGHSKGKLLLSYTLASSEMRYIEICNRDIYLSYDSESKPILQAEIPDCGSESAVDLNQILLEFSLSCEGCKDQDSIEESVKNFAEHLGIILVTKLFEDNSNLSVINKISLSIECLLNSMLVAYTSVSGSDKLHYQVSKNPIQETANRIGFTREIVMAHLAFITLCGSIIRTITPDWMVIKPTEADIDNPLQVIEISR